MTNVYFNQKMQKLMNNAWVLVRVKKLSMSAAMKMAWKVYNLRKKGTAGKVEFEYIKKDGELRHAIGTFNVKEMPADASNFKGTRTHTSMQVRYFDVEKQGWRSCLEENIVAIY